MNPNPQSLIPKWPQRLLRYFLKDEYLEEIEGDMEEIFQDLLENSSLRKARYMYAKESLKLIRPVLLKHVTSREPIITYAMLKHNLTLTLRNFTRYKTSFLINLMGLSTGIACSLLIYLWVQDERKVDKFHSHNDNLYLLLEHLEMGDRWHTQSNTSGVTGLNLVADFPEVVASVTARTKSINSVTLNTEDLEIKGMGLFASKDFFELFSFELLKGRPGTVLEDFQSVVLSESFARKIFGSTEGVIGKQMQYQHEEPLQVSGIFKDPPPSSSLQFDFVVSFEAWAEDNAWVNHIQNMHPQCFVLLEPETDIEAFNTKIYNYLGEKTEGEESHRHLHATPYSDYYLYGTYEDGKQAGGRIHYIWLFSLIAGFILLIACINFMNLATAKAGRRMKEVGLKKSIGAHRGSLIFQYLSESTLLAFLGLFVGLGFVLLFLPEFNQITGKHIHIKWDLALLGILGGIMLLTGLLAGSYPALYLSAMSPISTLKGKLKHSSVELFARKGLVIFQFTLSIILIVSVWIVYKQIQYVQSQNLGYDRENVIVFQKEGRLWEEGSQQVFLEELEKIPGVKHASSIGNPMTESNYGSNSLSWPGKDPNDRSGFEVMQVNYGMLDLLGIDLVEGRDFSPEFGTDTSKLIFNETAIRKMGMEDPIGQIVEWGDEFEIIGVVNDFHFESLHSPVSPLVFFLGSHGEWVMVKIQERNLTETLERIRAVHGKSNPGFPLEYSFLEADYEALYAAEYRISKLSRYFAGLAILISCLGLFGLAMFSAATRQKEIGIRKVLGASAYQLVRLLTDDFTKMVGIAILIGLPISYFLAKNWLDTFAFKTSLQWWYFLGAGAIAMLIAWFTVGLQTVQATQVDPVECLKDE